MSQNFKGKTEDAACPILKQSFWTKGTALTGRITRRFETEPEPGKSAWCFEIKMTSPLKVDAKLLSSKDLTGLQTIYKVGIAESAGLRMAIQASGAKMLQENDLVTVTATGSEDSGKGNPMTTFEISIEREKF